MEKEIYYFKEEIKKELTESRLEHSFLVAEIAKSIAIKQNYHSPDKAYLAGILHDITKQKPKQFHTQLFEKWDFNQFSELPEPAYHAYSARFYLREKYNFTDTEVLTAIQNHTLGSNSMSLLDKILYASDFLGSEYAKSQEGYDSWLSSSLESLNFGIYLKSSKTISDLLSKKQTIHTFTITIYNSSVEKHD
ncbi:MAG: bis(5'-nucleosyl)-tetraphosphatase (symmetrical) YqeK [Leptospiraceae bacterium]|nr:bis(5'-nucleosyl)-tetraphosphatase (symmetrical) YqeK [Leptospiraceae bacterium]MCP5494121.1 bis(5'-nucleosyl)-tetraphosphatase (symmetrical) YqeK [Leptospiraceae bacterium]